MAFRAFQNDYAQPIYDMSSTVFTSKPTMGTTYLHSTESNGTIPTTVEPTGDTIFDVPSILVVLILLVIILGTIIGNLLVCVAVVMVKKLRRPYNYLLVSLAVSDLCVAILVMPVALLNELLGRWQFGPVICDIWVSFDVLSCTASILNLCMISVDRYLAITKPLEYGVKRTPRRMFAYIAVVWIGAGFVSVPPVLILGNEHGDGTRCDVCQNFYYQIYATFASFYLPLSVMVTVYYKIFRAARRIVTEEKRARAHLKQVEEGKGYAPSTPAPLITQSLSPPKGGGLGDVDSASKVTLVNVTSVGDNQRSSVVEVRNGGINTRLSSSVIPLHSGNAPDKQSYEPLLAEQNKDQYLELPVSSRSFPSPCSTITTCGSSWSLPENSQCNSARGSLTYTDTPFTLSDTPSLFTNTPSRTIGEYKELTTEEKPTDILLTECSDNSENSLDSAVTIAYNNINNCDDVRDCDTKEVERFKEVSPLNKEVNMVVKEVVKEEQCFKRASSEDQTPPNLKKNKQSRMKFQLAKERKASTTLGIIMSAFIVCWLPFFVLALVRPFLARPTDIPISISSLFLWLGYANSTLNPIIYATLNKDFRKPFQEILCMRCSSLNHLMREDFYHSQFGPDTPTLSHVRVNNPNNPTMDEYPGYTNSNNANEDESKI